MSKEIMITLVSTLIFAFLLFPHLTLLISEVLLDVTVYVISPAAARWLATANRMVEWYAAPLDFAVI